MEENEKMLLVAKIKTEVAEEVAKGLKSEDVNALIDAKIKASGVDLDSINEIKGSLSTIETDITALKGMVNKSPENMTPKQAILNALKEKGITSYEALKAAKHVDIELKDVTIIGNADYTGDVSRTQEVSPVKFPRIRPLSFIGNGIAGGTVGVNKNTIMWTPGSYTSNVGYAAEKTGAGASEDTATAEEKYRKMAKIKAYEFISAESFEDLGDWVNQLIAKMQAYATVFLDTKIFDGVGADGTKPNEIYGIKTQGSTAFDLVNCVKVEKPNVGDLADACAVQAALSFYTPNTVRISPATAFKLRRTKDTTGQYIINRLADGSQMMAGLTVKETTILTNDEMIVSDDSLIQLWVKRAMQLKIGQFGDDVLSDNFTAVLFERAQCLVEDNDKLGVIYVASIAAGLTAIEQLDNA